MPEFYRLRPLFCVKMKNLPAGRAVAESAYLGRFGMKKAPCVFAESQFIPVDIKSDCAGNLAGTETASCLWQASKTRAGPRRTEIKRGA